jgi:Flp pilus assembly protein TadD
MQDKHEPALLLHQKAVRLSPKDARLHNNLGFGFSLLSRHPEAVKSYRGALALNPNMRSAYVNLGFSLGLSGQFDSARNAFSQVLKNAEVLNNLALVKELSGDPKGAINLYKEALDFEPGLAMARENLEAVESELKDTKEYK